MYFMIDPKTGIHLDFQNAEDLREALERQQSQTPNPKTSKLKEKKLLTTSLKERPMSLKEKEQNEEQLISLLAFLD